MWILSFKKYTDWAILSHVTQNLEFWFHWRKCAPYLKKEKNPESATRCKLKWLSFETITKSFCTYLLMDPLNYSLFYHVLLCNVTIYSGKNVTDSSLLTISFSFLTVNSFDPSRSSSMVHKIWIYFSKIPKFLFIIQRQWENNFG